jgi:hypothetical protein
VVITQAMIDAGASVLFKQEELNLDPVSASILAEWVLVAALEGTSVENCEGC